MQTTLIECVLQVEFSWKWTLRWRFVHRTHIRTVDGTDAYRGGRERRQG